MADAKPKPKRKPRAPASVSPPGHIQENILRAHEGKPPLVDPSRVSRLEARLDRFEQRLDAMADALAPALHAWRNIRSRIPGWILSLGDPVPPRVPRPVRLERESPSGDSEE